MSTSIAAHIPVLSLSKFKSPGAYDPFLADVLEPGIDDLEEVSAEERLQAEYERGRSDGEVQMRRHYEAMLEEERGVSAKSLEEERIRFDIRESANISAAIDGFMNVMEQRISYSLSRLLQPFLSERIVEQLVSAFADNLKQLAQDGDDRLIRLSGPQALIDQVLEQLPALRDRIDARIADQVELVALMDETTIETRLSQWLTQLSDLQKEAEG